MAIFGGGGLSVRISARTRDFTEGVGDAQRSLAEFGAGALSTTAPLQALEGRADEAGDELADVGREAGQASRRLTVLSGAAGAAGGSFAALTAGTHGLGLSFGSLTTSLTGTVGLLGAVGVAATGLLSTLVPLAAIVGTMTAGLGALAGAFGAILGTGIIAFGKERGEQNAERLEQVRREIQLLEEAEKRHGDLTNEQERQLRVLKEQEGKLEDTTGVMGGLTDAFGELRDELVPIIADFGEQFIPLIEDALDAIPDLVRNVFDAIGGVKVFTRALRDFGREAFRLIPRLTAFMFDLGRRALPVVRDFFGWLLSNGGAVFQGMLDTTRRLAPVFLGLVDAIIRAAPEINRLGTRILEVAVPALSGFLGTLEDVITKVFGFIDSFQGGDLDLGSSIVAFIQNGLTAVNEWLDSGGQQRIQTMLTEFFGSMAGFVSGFDKEKFRTEFVQPLLNVFGRIFDAVTKALQSEEAGRLSEELGLAARGIMEVFADEMVAYARSDAFMEDLSALSGAVTNTVARAIVAGITPQPGQAATPGGRAALHPGGRPSMAAAGAATPGGRQQVDVNLQVDGDNPLAEFIRDAVTLEFTTRESRNTRLGSRPGGL